MIIKENITIYQCGFCRKVYQRKPACEKHEQFCYANPLNMHKCFQGCQNLEKSKEQDDNGNMRTVFTCKVSGKEMYSYIAERRGIESHAIEFEAERMPLECEHYDDLPF